MSSLHGCIRPEKSQTPRHSSQFLHISNPGITLAVQKPSTYSVFSHWYIEEEEEVQYTIPVLLSFELALPYHSFFTHTTLSSLLLFLFSVCGSMAAILDCSERGVEPIPTTAKNRGLSFTFLFTFYRS
jgi:hypothetical protein